MKVSSQKWKPISRIKKKLVSLRNNDDYDPYCDISQKEVDDGYDNDEGKGKVEEEVKVLIKLFLKSLVGEKKK